MKKLTAVALAILFSSPAMAGNGFFEVKAGAITGMPDGFSGDKTVIGLSAGKMVDDNIGFDIDTHYWWNSESGVDEDLYSVALNASLSTEMDAGNMMFVPFIKGGMSYYNYSGSGCSGAYCASPSDTDFAPIASVGGKFVGGSGFYIGAQYSRFFTNTTDYDLGTLTVSVGKYF